MSKTRSQSKGTGPPASKSKGKGPARKKAQPRRGRGAGKMPAASTRTLSTISDNRASTSSGVQSNIDDTEITGASSDFDMNPIDMNHEVQFSDDELPLVDKSPVAGDIGAHLDENIVGKIIQGRYVQFSSLIPNKRVTQKLVFNEGTGSLSTVDNSRRLYNFSDWLDAFIIYSAIRGAAHPTEAVPLIKYLQTIKRIHGRNGNFIRYDDAFRTKYKGASTIPWHQLDSEELSWSMGDPEYTPYEDYVGRANHGPIQFRGFRSRAGVVRIRGGRACGGRSGSGPRPHAQRNCCYAYNYGRRCTKRPCPYSHVCKSCGSDHPFSACSKMNSSRPY